MKVNKEKKLQLFGLLLVLSMGLFILMVLGWMPPQFQLIVKTFSVIFIFLIMWLIRRNGNNEIMLIVEFIFIFILFICSKNIENINSIVLQSIILITCLGVVIIIESLMKKKNKMNNNELEKFRKNDIKFIIWALPGIIIFIVIPYIDSAFNYDPFISNTLDLVRYLFLLNIEVLGYYLMDI